MYVNHIKIYSLRSISYLDWSVQVGKEPGWHVILGDNGSGKTTFLRAVALALVGPTEALALRQNWNEWVAGLNSSGSVELELTYNRRYDTFTKTGLPLTDKRLPVKLTISKGDSAPADLIGLPASTRINSPRKHVWSTSSGWFSASFGPFRRFSGGDFDQQQLYKANPRLTPHLSIFGENVALTECLEWLQDLQFKSLENNPEGSLLEDIKMLVNSPGFLPHDTKLHSVNSSGVEFVDGNGYHVAIENLSDGFRSVLSLTFELIRQMSRSYGHSRIFDRNDQMKVVVPGVVLIDEVDAHLHPSWQRQIGLWFRRYFPNVQFLVTTHSPLVCQAAEVGSVWRLAAPGTSERGEMVTGIALERLLYGDVLDAYGTDLFGDVRRSDEGMRRLERLAQLNQKELKGKLTVAEHNEQTVLRNAMPTSASKHNGAT